MKERVDSIGMAGEVEIEQQDVTKLSETVEIEIFLKDVDINKDSSPSVQLKTHIDIEAQESTASRASTLSLKKKKVNIAKDGVRKRDEESDVDPDQAKETTALKVDEGSIAAAEDNYLTMSGTIKRGKKAGQNVDIKVNISREELERLETTRAKLSLTNSTNGPSQRSCHCGISKGVHIFLWSLICFPFVFLFAAIYSFYIGTFTWYNVFSWYTEEKPFMCRVCMAPILIITYPFLIILATIGLGIYSAVDQISCQWHLWLSKVQDLEKGFYAWLCSLLNLEECSPYTEVVIVDHVNIPTSASHD